MTRRRKIKRTKTRAKHSQHQDIAGYCFLLLSSTLIFATPSMLSSSPSEIKPNSYQKSQLILHQRSIIGSISTHRSISYQFQPLWSSIQPSQDKCDLLFNCSFRTRHGKVSKLEAFILVGADISMPKEIKRTPVLNLCKSQMQDKI